MKEFIVFLGTNNLEQTSAFYLNKLNLSLYKDQGICRIYSVTAQSRIGFCSHMPVVIDEKSPILTFVVDDVDEYYGKLRDQGVSIPEKPLMNEKFKIYHFFFRDPNGYLLEVQKFMD